MTVPPVTPPSPEGPAPSVRRTDGLQPFPVSQYAEHHGRRSYEPPPSRTTAVWALVLSFLGLFALVAIGLAIGVLRQSRDGLDHGKGMAIAALVIAPLTITLTHRTCSSRLDVIDVDADTDADRPGPDHRGPGHVSAARSRRRLPRRPGLEEVLTGGTADDVRSRRVPCAAPHAAEAFHDFTVDGDDYPGDVELQDRALRGCLPAFEQFVGIPFARSTFDVSYLGPTDDSWRLADNGSSCHLPRQRARRPHDRHSRGREALDHGRHLGDPPDAPYPSPLRSRDPLLSMEEDPR